jgi:predicted nucleotidyltransferase component of viral defense system
LKGGCNLRFYFKSIRYSEDIDLDVHIINKETLYNKVNRILHSEQFAQILQARKIQLIEISTPKQTETTQRWKLLLRIPTSDFPINTKIEFSRRKNRLQKNSKFEPVDITLIQFYQLTPILVNHYTDLAAYSQKIRALISRSEVQARDVFDLYLLLQRKFNSNLIDKDLKKSLAKAKNNILRLSFADFKSQTWAYLDPNYQQQYDSQETWEHIVLTVVSALEL